MKRKVIKVSYGNAQYEVIRDDSVSTNQFRIYYLWSELTEYGLKKRKKQVMRYADLSSCLFYLYDTISRNYSDRTLSEEAVIKETYKRR